MATLTVDQAAALKGVAANTIYRLLRDDTRRQKLMPKAHYVGKSPRGAWVLNEAEVAAWQPYKRK